MNQGIKRLFLFAGYDKDGIIDDTLVYYLNALSELGDIILVMDCNVQDTSKLNDVKNILHTEIARHGEYDFGSYKRAYVWARDNKILKKYDWVYLVNDSVYGPLWNLEPPLNTLESSGADFTGMIDHCTENVRPHIQTWFVGLSDTVINDPRVQEFFESIHAEKSKDIVVLKYEYALTHKLVSYGYKFFTLIKETNPCVHSIYDTPFQTITRGLPFIKRRILDKHTDLSPLLQYISEDVLEKIYASARKNNLEQQTTQIENIFRITVFGIPIIRVLRRKLQKCTTVSYKVLLFDTIPILKIQRTP